MITSPRALLPVCVLLLVLLAYFALTVPPIDLQRAFMPPGGEFLLGTTPLGQSVALSVLTGAGATVMIALSALLVALGLALACTAGLYLLPEAAERAYSQVVDAYLAVPGIFIALSIGYFLPQGTLSVVAALVLSEFAALQKFLLQRLSGMGAAEYVTMAHLMGAGPAHTLRQHVLPRLLRDTRYLFAVSMPSVALSLSALEFLGVQTGAEQISLGMQIALYKDYILLYPHLSLAPIAALLATLAALHSLAGQAQSAGTGSARGA